MASVSRCLVDARLLIDGARSGTLAELCRDYPVAVGELALQKVQQWLGRDERGACELAAKLAAGSIDVMRARVVEMADVVRWIESSEVSSAELEAIAIVLAGRARLCTTDRVVMRVMRELGIDDRCVVLAELLGQPAVIE